MENLIRILLQDFKIVVLIMIYLMVFIPGAKVFFKKLIVEFFTSISGTVLAGTISLTLIFIISENKIKIDLWYVVVDNFVFYFFILIVLFTYSFNINKIKNMLISILANVFSGMAGFVALYVI